MHYVRLQARGPGAHSDHRGGPFANGQNAQQPPHLHTQDELPLKQLALVTQPEQCGDPRQEYKLRLSSSFGASH